MRARQRNRRSRCRPRPEAAASSTSAAPRGAAGIGQTQQLLQLTFGARSTARGAVGGRTAVRCGGRTVIRPTFYTQMSAGLPCDARWTAGLGAHEHRLHDIQKFFAGALRETQAPRARREQPRPPRSIVQVPACPLSRPHRLRRRNRRLPRAAARYIHQNGYFASGVAFLIPPVLKPATRYAVTVRRR